MSHYIHANELVKSLTEALSKAQLPKMSSDRSDISVQMPVQLLCTQQSADHVFMHDIVLLMSSWWQQLSLCTLQFANMRTAWPSQLASLFSSPPSCSSSSKSSISIGSPSSVYRVSYSHTKLPHALSSLQCCTLPAASSLAISCNHHCRATRHKQRKIDHACYAWTLHPAVTAIGCRFY